MRPPSKISRRRSWRSPENGRPDRHRHPHQTNQSGDTLIIWKIDRIGRNLRDLIDIVTTLEGRGVGVQSLTNGIIDTTTGPRQTRLRHVRPDGRIRSWVGQRAHPGRTHRLPQPRPQGGRKPKMTNELIDHCVDHPRPRARSAPEVRSADEATAPPQLQLPGRQNSAPHEYRTAPTYRPELHPTDVPTL